MIRNVHGDRLREVKFFTGAKYKGKAFQVTGRNVKEGMGTRPLSFAKDSLVNHNYVLVVVLTLRRRIVP